MLNETHRTIEMVETPERLIEMVSLFSRKGYVAVDTETTGLQPHQAKLRLIQLAADDSHCFIVDMYFWRSVEALGPLARLFADPNVVKVAHNAKFEVKFLTHHLLRHHHGLTAESFFCTQLASTIVSAGEIKEKHSLAATVERYLNEVLDKTQQLSDWNAPVLSDEQLRYAAMDVYVLLPLYRKLCEAILQQDLWRTCLIEMDALLAIAEMELAGLPVDRQRWSDLLVEKIATRDALRAEVVSLLQPGVDWLARNPAKVGTRPVKPKKECGRKPSKSSPNFHEELATYNSAQAAYLLELNAWERRFQEWSALPDEVTPEINLNSPSQVQKALENVGVPLEGRKTNEKELLELVNLLEQRLLRLQAVVTGLAAEAQATAAEYSPALNAQLTRSQAAAAAIEHALHVINRLLEYRGAEKSVTSYGENILELLSDEDRLHADFQQIGAETGRVSCRQPNVQQIPHDPAHRRCIRAPQGMKLLISDYAQIELRIMAQLSGDANFISDFRSGKDMHTLGAARFFNVPYAEVTKDLRQYAKAVNFLVIYGGGAGTLSARLKCPVEKAQELLDAYFKAYPQNQVYMQKASNQAMHRGFARTMMGRLIRFDILSAKAEDDWRRLKAFGRNGMNAPIQGTSADMLKRALYYLREKLKGTSGRIVNIVHDEVVVLCAEKDAEAVAAHQKWALEKAGTEFLSYVDCPVDVDIAEDWSEKH